MNTRATGHPTVPLSPPAARAPVTGTRAATSNPRRRTRAERARDAATEHERRHRLALELASLHGGVVTRGMLLDAGLTRGQIEVEVSRGVWRRAGRHTLSVAAVEPRGEGLWWRALWESGSRSVLDGTTALIAGGLRGWTDDRVHVSVPNGAVVRPIPGVRHHRLRALGDSLTVGLRRTKPAVAVVRAAQWAASDRQAATIVAMTVQQRLVAPASVLARWEEVLYSARREVLAGVIADVCDGAHSLSELDFARLCRRRGLEEPERQAVRTSDRGRIYLDAWWERRRVHVEIQGAHHDVGTAGIDDSLRFNAVRLGDPRIVTLQIPVLGLRTCPERFLDQLEAALCRHDPQPGAA